MAAVYGFPFGQFNWFSSTGLVLLRSVSDRKQPQKCRQADVSCTWVARHLLYETNSGHPGKGNRIAAIYGLYFYPDCDKVEYNWVQDVKYQEKTLGVRMRLPN